MDSEYYLVRSDVLPEVFSKVMAVKRLLSGGQADSIQTAVRQVGISRSAYYKYKDAVLPFFDSTRGRLVTLIFVVEDFPGILSGIIRCLADQQANILTINQNIPLNGLADVAISIETNQLRVTIKELMDELGRIPGVRSHRIMARE